MNKEQFLLTMQNALSGMPRADLERTLQYYREMIEDRMEEGMDELSAVADVGDPIELAEAIRSKPVKQTAVRAPKPPKEPRPMSAGARAALIVVAILLVAAGLSLIVASLNIQKSMRIKDYSFGTAAIRALEIDSGSADVKLIPVTDTVCRVQCTESSVLRTKVSLEDGTLHIVRRRVGAWSLFSISLKEDFIYVMLPVQDYDSLWVRSSSGGVSVPEDFRFNNAIISASSGGIGFSAAVTGTLDLETSSGGVALADVSPAELRVAVSSGGLAIAGGSPGNVDLHCSSGGMRLSDVHCDALAAETSSGGIRFSDVIASGKMTLECTSGSIRLEDCDAAELRIQCTSGSVSGHLLTPKIYSASATSGSVRVPTGGSGGLCEVKTTSGSIHFD